MLCSRVLEEQDTPWQPKLRFEATRHLDGEATLPAAKLVPVGLPRLNQRLRRGPFRTPYPHEAFIGFNLVRYTHRMTKVMGKEII